MLSHRDPPTPVIIEQITVVYILWNGYCQQNAVKRDERVGVREAWVQLYLDLSLWI